MKKCDGVIYVDADNEGNGTDQRYIKDSFSGISLIQKSLMISKFF